jgi:hypothetical protein
MFDVSVFVTTRVFGDARLSNVVRRNKRSVGTFGLSVQD